uniref:Uncharacterized protein n=1 Tax=Arundo donax TaxID=35708 RepID=A0A0A9H744_ARUDO
MRHTEASFRFSEISCELGTQHPATWQLKTPPHLITFQILRKLQRAIRNAGLSLTTWKSACSL